MSKPAPAGAHCKAHPDQPAAWTCGRCGSFFCQACERRTRPEALPMCPECWDLRATRVVPQNTSSGSRLQTAGLVMGFVALIPNPLLALLSVVVNIVALARASTDEARRARWRPIVGLVLTGVGVLEFLALIFSRHYIE